MAPRFDITRVRLRNFKSIESCDVELGPLTLLVGPNGSGKVSWFGQGDVAITVEFRLGDQLFSCVIVAVLSSRAGVGVVGPLGPVGERAMKESLLTPGELLRADYLQPIGVA
jgi:hypothetical protein